MTGVDEREVRRIAELARLRLEEAEVARYARDLEEILGHFDELRGLELAEGAGPEARDLEPRLRPDAPGPDPLAFGPEEIAPAWRGGFFLVPRLPAMSGPAGEEA